MSDVHRIRMVHGLLLRALPLTDWRLVRILTETGSEPDMFSDSDLVS